MLNNKVLEFLLNKISKDYLNLEESARTGSLALKTFVGIIDDLKADLVKKDKELEEFKNSKDFQEEISELKNDLKEQRFKNRELLRKNKELNEKLSLFSTMKKIEGEIKK